MVRPNHDIVKNLRKNIFMKKVAISIQYYEELNQISDFL